MIRFLFGIVVGAFVVVLIQLQFSLIPANDRDPGVRVASADKEQVEAQVGYERAAPELPPAGVSRRQTVESPSGGANLELGSPRESEALSDLSGQSGPKLPIELPDTHAGFVDKEVRSLPDEHAKVEAEEVDPAWAEQVEAQIYSFVSSHPSGPTIQLVSLVCRTTRCEIVGSVFGERGGETWNQVLSDMREQAWFASNFADSMFGSGGGFPGEFRFITILARVGSEIAAPVPQ